MADRPMDLAWLRSWVAARYLLAGSKRTGVGLLRQAITAAGLRRGRRLAAYYGLFTVRQLARRHPSVASEPADVPEPAGVPSPVSRR